MKKLKNIVSVFVILFISSAFNLNAQTSKAEIFEESVAIITQDRLPTNGCKNYSAKQIKVISFNKNYKLPNKINFCGGKFTDDGTGNDVKAGDGIYTSIGLYQNIKNSETVIITFDKFKYKNDNNYQKFITNRKNSSGIHCYFVYVAGIPLIACEIEIEF